METDKASGRFVGRNYDNTEIINEYTSGKSTLYIARKLGCSDTCIRYRLKKHGIKLRSNKEYCKIDATTNLCGQKFGKLLVVEQDKNPTRKSREAFWSCVCDCGKTHIVRGNSLKRGSTTECISCSNPKLGFKELPQCFWGQVKAGAIKRGLEFTITIEEAWGLFIKQDKKCSLSGLSIGFAKTRREHMVGRKTTASLDRIDNNKGYIIDNVQWVHKDVNMMKHCHNQEYFLNMCKLITNHNDNNKNSL